MVTYPYEKGRVFLPRVRTPCEESTDRGGILWDNDLYDIDEYVDLDTFETVTKAIALATLEWCSRDRETTNSP